MFFLRMELAAKKVKVKEDLSKLEEVKLLSSNNHYQEMINLIAQDIRNQRRYREMRRQVTDLYTNSQTISNSLILICLNVFFRKIIERR